MDGVVDGWWTATMFQQGCGVSGEGAESRGVTMFMYDNAPSHAARNAAASLAAIEEKLIVWPPIFP